MNLVSAVLEAPDREAATRILAAASDADRRDAVEPLAQEVVRLLRVDARQALEAAERTGDLATSLEDDAAKARAGWVRAHALAGLLRNEEALALYREAKSFYMRVKRRADAARIGIGEVNALTYLGRYDEALRIGEHTRRALRDTRQPVAAARLDMNLGNLHHRLERPGRALECYDRALLVARRRREADMCRLIQLNRGTALSAMGKLDRAERLYLEVRREAGRAGEQRIRAFVDFNLGYVLFQRGEYGRAYDTLDAARVSFEELGDPHYLALTLIDLAELLLEVARFSRAAEIAGRARSLVGRLGLRFEEARATLFQGIAVLGQGDIRGAGERLAEARGLFREEGNRSSEAVCDVWLAELKRRTADPAGAMELLGRAIPVFGAEKLRIHETAARIALAAASCDAGELGRARGELQLVRRRLRLLPSPWLAARAHHLQGRLCEAEGAPTRAIRHYRDAIRRIEAIRGRIGIDEFRVSFADDRAPIYADLIELTLRNGSARGLGEAFTLVERARSRALVDLLAGRLDPEAARGDAEAARLLGRLNELRGEISRLSGFGGDRRPGLRRSAVNISAVRQREEEMTETLRRLDRRNAALGALAGGAELVKLEDLQASLPADTEVVEYYLGARGSWAIVAGRDRAEAVRLDVTVAEVAARMERFRFQIEKCCHGDEYASTRRRLLHDGITAHLTRLSEMLWRPLRVSASRVIVVPHGPLHSLPFSALPSGDGMVIDRHLVSALPSASCARYVTSVLRPDIDRRQGIEPRVLAVEAGDASIPETRREVDSVRRAFRRGRTLRGRAASRDRFRTASPDADVIHLATHGIFRADDPSFSSVGLADGWLSLHDIYALRLEAKLVCLSACQTGRSWAGPGDELVGLIRGFLHAGAGSLLVSLWPVSDRSTASLMEAFYAGVRRQQAFDVALRDAMLAVRAEWPHPFHWAPFVLIGGAAVGSGAAGSAARAARPRRVSGRTAARL